MRALLVASSSLALAALVVASGFLLQNDRAAAEGGIHKLLGDSLGFGQRVAGTYMGSFSLGHEIRLLATLGADGTLVSTDSEDYSLGPVTGDLFDSPKHGAWERTGPREISATQLEFSYDPDGTLILTTRIRAVVSFVDATFNEADALFDLEIFTADQDVLDPEAMPITVVEGISTVLRRVRAR